MRRMQHDNTIIIIVVIVILLSMLAVVIGVQSADRLSERQAAVRSAAAVRRLGADIGRTGTLHSH